MEDASDSEVDKWNIKVSKKLFEMFEMAEVSKSAGKFGFKVYRRFKKARNPLMKQLVKHAKRNYRVTEHGDKSSTVRPQRHKSSGPGESLTDSVQHHKDRPRRCGNS